MNKRYIAVDFDGTISLSTPEEYPAPGEINPGAAACINYLQACGYVIILWTCRTGDVLDIALRMCDQNGITFDYVNENPEMFTSRKIFAHHYIDDAAIGITKKTFKDAEGRHRLGVDWDVIKMFFGVRLPSDTDRDTMMNNVIVLDDSYVE